MSTQAEMDAAIAATEKIIADDPTISPADPTLPIFRLNALDDIEVEHGKFEAGDKMALLAAIRICANHDLQMPEWVSRAFIRAYDQVLGCRSDSWDVVFGRPYKKGAHLSRMREARTKRFAVWSAINAAVQRNEPINRELFESVGRDLGIGKTRAEELYAQAKRRIGSPAKK